MADCRAAVITAYNAPLEILAVPIPIWSPARSGPHRGLDPLWHGRAPLARSAQPEGYPPVITGHEPCGSSRY